ncbi:YwqG family protein [Micromonospora sp. BRA006-A]|uniref:YwqG family protein n=1 Tax=Micromonospora sp. BRA006-A TaxID=2962860 RepID=UPI00296F50F2|nr:YwqG family protein [Micromonospora sp. BRA006-A]MDW3848505.1 YwqG family protein [Micromonospora sp. BRA006-A]
MDERDQFRRAAIEQGVPEDEVARFAELIRFPIHAWQREEGVHVGRRGGRPRLPVGMPWPTCSEGFPLPFLLRLDCAALPRVPGLALPADGTLLFFLDQESALDACGIEPEQEFARVVYVPAGAETADGEYVVPADTEMEPFLAPEHEMYAGLQAELPDWLDRSEEWLCDTQIQLLRDMPHRKEMSALVEQLWPERNWHLPDDVFVGGYTLSAQDPPEAIMMDPERVQQLWSLPRAERMEARYEEQQRVMREWVPLAQFGVPDEEYVNARFLIRHDDLAARRFDRVLSFCEFTE